jgi:GNAT superfamily N-acetyltransferase
VGSGVARECGVVGAGAWVRNVSTGPRAGVRPATAADVAATAALQVRHLRNGLFPQLGPRFVRRWHATFVDEPQARAYVVDDGDGVRAFLVGTVDQQAYVAGVLRRERWALARLGLLAMLARPTVAWMFLRTRSRLYARRVLARRLPPPLRDGNGAPVCVAVVHAVVTDPRGRGSGAGAALLARFEEDVRAAGTPQIQLITDDGPRGAGGFYRRLGWGPGERAESRDGRPVLLFRRRVLP